MRYLFSLVCIIVLALAAALVSQLYLNDPVTIRYGEWSAAPLLSLALGTLALGAIALMVALRLLLAIVFLPSRLAKWRRQFRAKKQVQLRENAMRQAVYGNCHEALKLFAELAPADAAAAWRAAEVAEEIGDTRARDKHLQQAADSADAVISAAAKAKRCMQDSHLIEADAVLKSAGAPRAAVLLAKLYYDVQIARGDYTAAYAAAAHLREKSPRLFGRLAEDAVQQRLKTFSAAAEVKAFWREQVPAADKKQAPLLALYLAALWQLGDEKAAADGLTQALRQHPHDNDILRLVADFGTAAHCEAAFKANEKRADSAGARDMVLLQLLIDIAEKLKLSGKVRLYGQMLSQVQRAH